jgi:hypothetical protein
MEPASHFIKPAGSACSRTDTAAIVKGWMQLQFKGPGETTTGATTAGGVLF